MIEVKGNLWTYPADVRVITTNGTVKKDGTCVMGRGCALEAKKMLPWLPQFLGSVISKNGNSPYLLDRSEDGQLYSFPVKHNWYGKADIRLIEESAKAIIPLINSQAYLLPYGARTIVIPRPGCGNGGLNWADVKPVLEPILDDRFHVITF